MSVPLKVRPSGAERGFTLIELLVASAVTMLVLGGAAMLTSQVQAGYRRQIEAAAAEQEARYALEWIGKLIRGTHNYPLPVVGTCSAIALSDAAAIGLDPNPDGDGVPTDIRLMTDSNPVDGQVGGPNELGVCDQANEDVTVSLDAANNTILFRDNSLGIDSVRTGAVIEDLRFVYRNSSHMELDLVTTPADAAAIRYVEVQITARTLTINAMTGLPDTRTLTSEVRVRSR